MRYLLKCFAQPDTGKLALLRLTPTEGRPRRGSQHYWRRFGRACAGSSLATLVVVGAADANFGEFGAMGGGFSARLPV